MMKSVGTVLLFAVVLPAMLLAPARGLGRDDLTFTAQFVKDNNIYDHAAKERQTEGYGSGTHLGRGTGNSFPLNLDATIRSDAPGVVPLPAPRAIIPGGNAP